MKTILRDALLEIGTEELPARFISPGLSQLSEKVTAELTRVGVEFSGVELSGSPRRLAILIKGLAPKAADRTDVAVGPPPAAAKDAAGNWTPAATGFAKAQNVAVEKLVVQDTPKGPRLVALHPVKGQRTETILKELFPSVIQSLSFPKTMAWEAGRVKFARPIRWIAALFHNKVVPFRVAGVSSSNATYGLLALGGQKLIIKQPAKYRSLLQGRCILVDPAARRKNILSQLEALSKRLKAVAIAEDAHVDEVVHLTEYPVSIVGSFPEAYLKLPREILITVLRKHQKFFPLETSKGQLTHHFIGVRNGPSEYQEDVREGYERVVNARFSDAQFFHGLDSAKPLAEMAPKLSGIMFHQKLGTMAEKTARVAAIVKNLAGEAALEAAALQTALRAAELSKVDLVTQIVGEFPELQGVAGRFYAQLTEAADVAAVIEQHYWPLTAEGRLPASDAAAAVAVADKIDTLLADFSIGLVPSGSADPYGLRRAAIGLIRIMLDRRWNLGFDQLIDWAASALNAQGRVTITEQNRKVLKDFLLQRFSAWFANQGYRAEEIDAVMSRNGHSLPVAVQKLDAIKTLRGRPEFDSLAAALKRAKNLLDKASSLGYQPQGGGINQSVFEHDAEKALYSHVSNVKPTLESLVSAGKFEEALRALAPLKEPVDAFFNGVMVLAENPALRVERVKLLVEVKALFDTIADFSKLQGAAPVSAAR